MLIGEIVAAVAVVVLAITLLTRRAAHDDVHSVQGYHRSLHTLETINTHPSIAAGDHVAAEAVNSAFPESAVRLARRPDARATGPGSVPPVTIPRPTDPDIPLTFDDVPRAPEPARPAMFPPLRRDKAMVSINHRPRRLAAPAMAVAAVLVLIAVLLVTGLHSVDPTRTRPSVRDGHATAAAPKSHHRRSAARPSTAPLPTVSSALAATAHSATYDVADRAFTLTLVATSGPCWVDATSSTTGTTYFSGTLAQGSQQSLDAAGPVTVIVGAPSAFAARVDGVPVGLPPGFQTPFTMSFATPVTPPA
jgi:hypothetical protein